MSFTERNCENAVKKLFRNTLGYIHTYGPDLTRDYSSPLYIDDLPPALQRGNQKLLKAIPLFEQVRVNFTENAYLVSLRNPFLLRLMSGMLEARNE